MRPTRSLKVSILEWTLMKLQFNQVIAICFSFDVALSTAENMLNNHVTKELKCFRPRPRLIWEVYAGESRMLQIAETLGCQVEVFGYETGWDFDDPSHRRTFLKKLDEEMPDEVYLAPRCGLWSPMQSINALTPENCEELSIQRQQP